MHCLLEELCNRGAQRATLRQDAVPNVDSLTPCELKHNIALLAGQDEVAVLVEAEEFKVPTSPLADVHIGLDSYFCWNG